MGQKDRHRIAVIGAGIGGLAAALRLSSQGAEVDLFEAHSKPGGKMRCLPTAAGPVDAGPTVLTMRYVFEDLFAAAGTDLAQELTLLPQQRLARHFWSDGTSLDLFADPDRNSQEIAHVFGAKAQKEFTAFQARTKLLFDSFTPIMMEAPEPSLPSVTRAVLSNPRLISAMAPHQSLHGLLRRSFSEPKLIQLFSRYATYVGGSPIAAPALLSLIWQSEARGVWQVEGGMHMLAQTIERLARERGVRFHYDCPISDICCEKKRAKGLRVKGETLSFDAILFNGDPAALTGGHLGKAAKSALPKSASAPRAHSAHVWSFSAVPKGAELGLHNVFFDDDPLSEFQDLANGKEPKNPSIYIYAQDRGQATPPQSQERFEIILNAPPLPQSPNAQEEPPQCLTQMFQRLKAMGLDFTPRPEPSALTTPRHFNHLFPASQGSLYGRSPHGMMAAFQRPTARSRIKGLYLTGGGVHPGAGVPMATLSARHAAEAIMSDLTLTSTSQATAMRGGMSTA